MYTAITNPELLRPWLEIVEKLKLPLAGIHSAAVFSSVVLEELDLIFPHTLLVTFTPGDEMRQTFFRDREIKFSRLTPIDLEEGQTLGAMIAEETTRTWQYLDSLRHFSESDRLEVCILVHPNDRPAVEPALRDAGPIQYRLLDMELVATKLGLKPPPLDSTAEEVMVHLFMMSKAQNHFASPELRRYATLRSVGLLLNRVSVGLLLVALGWGGWNLSRVFHENATDEQLAQQLRGINREYEEISRSMPSFGVGGSTMRDTVSFYNVAIRPFPTLSDFLAPVSGVLQNHPGVRLNQLAWQATDDAKATPKVGVTSAPHRPARESGGESGRSRGPPATTPPIRRLPAVATKWRCSRASCASPTTISGAPWPRWRSSPPTSAGWTASAPTWSKARSTPIRRLRCRDATRSASRPSWRRASSCAWCASTGPPHEVAGLHARGLARPYPRPGRCSPRRSSPASRSSSAPSSTTRRRSATRSPPASACRKRARAWKARAASATACRNRPTCSAPWSTAGCCRRSAGSTWSSW
jgi:hypothetical protein